ncbi:hypothetical protein TNCV_3084421 [Trichonephila clavipes]|nr:hypothetical protein TNCV_3084421 [Trichonephila clavipes]
MQSGENDRNFGNPVTGFFITTMIQRTHRTLCSSIYQNTVLRSSASLHTESRYSSLRLLAISSIENAA